MRLRGRHALAALALGLALGAAGCGQEKEKSEGVTPPASSASPTDVPGKASQEIPGVAADGVNDDQGGSIPGNQPSSQAP
jgi:hypothetical protein